MHDEYRLRHRYLDLIHNPQTLARRWRVRFCGPCNYLDARLYGGETPTLRRQAASVHHHHNALDIDLFPAHRAGCTWAVGRRDQKRTEIGRVNGQPQAQLEFTMPVYQAYGDYRWTDEGLIVACGRHGRRPRAAVDKTVDSIRRGNGLAMATRSRPTSAVRCPIRQPRRGDEAPRAGGRQDHSGAQPVRAPGGDSCRPGVRPLLPALWVRSQLYRQRDNSGVAGAAELYGIGWPTPTPS